tara:strand:+ start:2986 stop:4575 length:1590 start_codon:yes stop_codon:yes gene_type:complete
MSETEQQVPKCQRPSNLEGTQDKERKMDQAEDIVVGLVKGVEFHARANPAKDCLIFDDRVIDFDQFSTGTTEMARALTGRGFSAGDRIAVLAQASPLFFELLFAAAKANLILVPINNRLSVREVGDVLADAGPRLLIVADEYLHLVDGQGPWEVVAEHDLGSWVAAQSVAVLPLDRSPDDPMLILYTSGTTGIPKGVVLTERNLSYLCRMARDLWEFSADSTNLVSTPLFHIGGIGWGLLALSQGGRTVVARDTVPEALTELMRRHRITHAFMVPTVIQRLVDFIDAQNVEPPAIEHLFYGAAPIGDALLRRAIAAFGCQFHHVYGMTETAGTVVTLDPADHDPDGPNIHRLQSCGKPMPWVEIAIVDPDSGKALESGAVGEVRLRSDAITRGYWRKDEESAKAITADGWLCTGDAGELDADGYLYLRDRYKDMIVSGGENIYPKEIENVLQFHPAVLEVAVIGVPHEKWGETPLAIVVLRPGFSATADDIMEFTRRHLARYKAPSRVEFRESLPRNASGKVMKHVLRA